MEQSLAIKFMNLQSELVEVETKKALGQITKEDAKKLKKRISDKWYRLEKKANIKVSKKDLSQLTNSLESVKKTKDLSLPENVEPFPDDEVEQDALSFLDASHKLPITLQEKIRDALRYFNVSSDDFVQLRKAESFLKLLPGNKNYAIIDITYKAERFELTDSKFSKVFKNKSCGTWKSIVNNKNIFVYEF